MRERLWPAIWATVITFTIVVTAGGVLLATQALRDRDRPAPARVVERVTGTSATPTPGAGVETTRLVVAPPRQLVDARIAPGEDTPVPLDGVPDGSTALLLDVSVVGAAAAGEVELVTGDGATVALRAPAKGAQTSATLVVQVAPGEPLRVRNDAGGRLLVTLAGAFVPAEEAAAGRIVPVPPEGALVFRPTPEKHSTRIDTSGLDLGGGRASAGALLLTFEADVGPRGGFIDVAGQQVYWGATSGSDRTRRGFLVVPVGSGPIPLTYRAGTELRVAAVGYVTGESAERSAAGLSVPAAPAPFPPVTVPAGGRTDVPLAAAGPATAALVTTAVTPPGARPRAVLSLVPVRDGSALLAAPEGTRVTVTPRLFIR